MVLFKKLVNLKIGLKYFVNVPSNKTLGTFSMGSLLYSYRSITTLSINHLQIIMCINTGSTRFTRGMSMTPLILITRGMRQQRLTTMTQTEPASPTFPWRLIRFIRLIKKVDRVG